MNYSKLNSFSSINQLDGTIDILISGISFEERCTALCHYIKNADNCKAVVLYENDDIITENDPESVLNGKNAVFTNANKIVKHLDKKGIPYKRFNSLHRNLSYKVNIIDKMIEYIGCYKSANPDVRHIAIDATCFTRIDLLIVLDHLYDLIQDALIKIIYISPESHADWLTKGYSGIDNILGFAGSFDYTLPTALVIVSGFEEERPQNFIEEYEPDIVLFGLSRNPTKLEFKKINEEKQAKILEYDGVIPFDFSADNIKNCYDELEKTITPYLQGYNLVIAPLCTKLSVIATFMLTKKYPKIQLAYCYPREYNWRGYSKGMADIFIENLWRA